MKRFINISLCLILLGNLIITNTPPAKAAGDALNIRNMTIDYTTSVADLIGIGKGYTFNPNTSKELYWLNRSVTQTGIPAVNCTGCGRQILPALTYTSPAYDRRPIQSRFNLLNSGSAPSDYRRYTFDLAVAYSGSFAAYTETITRGETEPASANIPTYRGKQQTSICPNVSCNTTNTYYEYYMNGYNDDASIYNALTRTYTVDLKGAASSVTYSNCTFTCSPPGIDPRVKFYFYNCTFKAGVPTGNNVVTRGCTGSLGTLTDEIDLTNNTFSLSRFANYAGTKYTPQTLANQGKVVTLIGAAATAASNLESLYIPNGSGVGWTDGGYKEITLAPDIRETWLRVAALPSYTTFQNLTGEVTVNQRYTEDLTLSSFSGEAGLSTQETITMNNSSLNNSKLTATGNINSNGSSITGTTYLTSNGDITLNGGRTSSGVIISAKDNLNFVNNHIVQNAVTASAQTIDLSSLSPTASSVTLNLTARKVIIPKLTGNGTSLGLNVNQTPIELKQSALKSLNLSISATEKLDANKEEQPTSYIDRVTLSGGATINTGVNNLVKLTSLTCSSRVQTLGNGEVIIDGGTYSGSPARGIFM